ncbi:hypothetical protein V6N11_032029 [Hibiscus sabdariffa]|uniref:Uncharacterized protein n=1 Tax=Hibiscus sabdariffa TaxID=183260 RepID=A0ABR2T056_9ROSI
MKGRGLFPSIHLSYNFTLLFLSFRRSLPLSLMGCGISKIDIPKGGDSSQLYSQLAIVHGSNDRSLWSRHAPTGNGSYHKKRGDVGKEEACIDKESSSEGDFNDRCECDGVSYMASPSFKVYCVPSQLDDGSSEGDSNPDEIMDPKMDLGYYNKRAQTRNTGIRYNTEGILYDTEIPDPGGESETGGFGLDIIFLNNDEIF